MKITPTIQHSSPCTDQESFFRGGPASDLFKLMRGSKYHYHRPVSGPPFKMAFRRRLNDGSTLNPDLAAMWFFQGIRISFAKKPYIFCDFQAEGSRPPTPLPLDTPMCGLPAYQYQRQILMIKITICTPFA